MQGMFEWCFNLKEIDLSTLNTENLENMGEMLFPEIRLFSVNWKPSNSEISTQKKLQI